MLVWCWGGRGQRRGGLVNVMLEGMTERKTEEAIMCAK